MCMMELLPKDIIGIVYRYLRDYNYANVKRDYERVWLNDESNRHGYVYWNEYTQCFIYGDRHVANWRGLVVSMPYYQHQHPVRHMNNVITVFRFFDWNTYKGPLVKLYY